MDLDGDDDWSPLADDWARTWGRTTDPVRHALLRGAEVGTGTRLLDAGCGSGELLRLAADLGAAVSGCDPAPGMLAHAAGTAPEADLRRAGLDALPWPAGVFDVVTAVNALQFAEDPEVALAEVRRVLAPCGRFGVAVWAERALNDVDVLETAVAAADGEELRSDSADRGAGGLDAALADAGFAVVASGLTRVVWEAPDDASLVAGILLGEDASVLRDLGPVVIDAATPFRGADGAYRLVNHVRWTVGLPVP